MTVIPQKPDHSLYTDGQWHAIYDSGKNLLVSASAGSGKTTVLVERVIEKIKNGMNVDELLVVTFTNAAAKEMKTRIQEAVQEAVTTEKDMKRRRHLIAQIPLLPHANISTLHSFCLQIIRRYYYLIDLDPVFRPLTDETERVLLQEEAWDEVREELYGKNSERFFRLAEAFSNDRNDEGLTELIFSLYFFAQANPQPKKWLNELSAFYQVDEASFTNSSLYVELLKPTLLQVMDTLIELTETGISLANGEEELKKQIDRLESDLTQYRLINEKIQLNQVDEIYPLVQQYQFETWPRVSKKKMNDEQIETATTMKNFRDSAKEMFNKQLKNSYFDAPLVEHIQRMQDSVEVVEEMATVTSLFMDRYAELKRSRKLIDFNDFEHLALSILTAQNDLGQSEASAHYRNQFKEVMIDEYQDTNQTQEEILRLLAKPSSEDGNRFMVGDVKQSIYAFRLADPQLFINKYENYSDGNEGERIILAENFRSRKEILDFTNLLFVQLMNKEVGQLAYDTSAELKHGFQAFEGESSYNVELLIYEKEEEEEEEEIQENEEEPVNPDFSIDTKTEGELLMVGGKIKELIQSKFELYDKKKKTTRPVQYKDIVLLTPTKMNNLVIQELFQSMDIPVNVSETQNYFRTTEISIMMSLLKIIDNPYQDIPLAAVLRSPIVGLNEQELALIRISDKNSSYYHAMITFWENHQENGESSVMERSLQKKLDTFLHQLNIWREEARRNSIVELIWSIYRTTGFLDYVGGMSAGKQRKANLHALYERARHYEQTNFKGLFQFIRFIEKMQQKEKDLAEPAALSEDENAVRVMTIHGSKGLEFPVVFVLDLTKKLSQQDLKNNYVFDQKYGVGIDYKDLENRIRYSTLPELLLKQEKKNLLRSEELRVLYVALTRAEQKLFLVGSYKNEEEAWNKWQQVAQHEEVVLPAQLRLNAQSMMDWIGMSLVRHPSSEFGEFDVTPISEINRRPGPFSIRFFKKEEIYEKLNDTDSTSTEEWYDQFKKTLSTSKQNIKFSNMAQKAISLMEKQYEHEKATKTTSYQSVSEIKRLFEEPHDGRLSKIDIEVPRNQYRYVEEELARPSFISELTKPSGAEIGQASHLLLQSLDLSEKPTEILVHQKIQELETKGIFSKDVAQKIPVQQITSFFRTEFGEYIIDHSDQLHREVPFALLMEANKLYPDMKDDGEDKILVHGIIDGYIEEENGIVLFDYKTDRVKRFGSNAQEMMRKKYSGQLRLYKEALESILDKEVRETILVLLDINELVRIS